MLHLQCPVEEGGAKIEARPLNLTAEAEAPVRYFFEPEKSEPGGGSEDDRREITKEEYEALPPARHTLPESDPRHKPPREA